jgi:hypothetical protein
VLDIMNLTHARWFWNRNQDGISTYADAHYIKRLLDGCSSLHTKYCGTCRFAFVLCAYILHSCRASFPTHVHPNIFLITIAAAK